MSVLGEISLHNGMPFLPYTMVDHFSHTMVDHLPHIQLYIIYLHVSFIPYTMVGH